MKHGFLIMMHKNPEQVLRMIRSLDHEDVTFFIHADEKMSYDSKLFESNNIVFTDRRYNVALFHFSMVEATLELIATAKQYYAESMDIGYLVLLSGQDYPIKPIQHIMRFFDDTWPKIHMDITPRSSTNWVNVTYKKSRVGKRIRRISQSDNKWKRRILNAPILLLKTFLSITRDKISGTPYQRVTKMGFLPYGGRNGGQCRSAWHRSA